MMTNDTKVIYIPFEDKRLGRHIRHDPRSRMFAAPTRSRPSADKRHRRHGKKLNQGNVGACTGFAAAHMLNTDPYRYVRAAYGPTFNESDALEFYGVGTTIDPFDGVYPPTDTGSSALAVAQGLKDKGWIPGYEWAFGFEHGLTTIVESPWMQGTYWTEDMFFPNADGRVVPTGGDAGGHEYLWVGVDIVSKRLGSNRSWFMNSWGEQWGAKGYFYMTWDDHEALLARDGDLVRASFA